MILSDPESNYDSSFDGEDVGGHPADACTLKSRNGKESWSIAPICSSQSRTSARKVVFENSRPTSHASRLCSSASDCFFLFFQTNFLEETCKWTKQRRKTNFSMQLERYNSHRAEKLIGVLLIGVYKFNHENFSQL